VTTPSNRQARALNARAAGAESNGKTRSTAASGLATTPAPPGNWDATRAALGRPVDVLQLPDGSVLISDDTGNRILRVSYRR